VGPTFTGFVVIERKHNTPLLQEIFESVKDRLAAKALRAHFKQEAHACLFRIGVRAMLGENFIVSRKERSER
jgi:hypothetical protein